MAKSKFSAFFYLSTVLEKKGHIIDREELIYQFTDGKKTSLKELTPTEYKELIKNIKRVFDLGTSEQAERAARSKLFKKLKSIWHYKLCWSYTEFDSWCIKYSKPKKKAIDMSQAELRALIPILQKVLNHHITQVTS